jgi:hypothetical protein
MKGEGLLGVVCVLLLATGATSCRLEVEGAKPTQKTQESGWPADTRQSPLSKTPEKSDTQGSSQAGICEPGASPVIIVVVESPRKVQSASALWKATPIVVQKAETVVFSDGRIVTSQIEETGPLLQSLGWTHRKIEIVGGLPAASGAWQRRRG